MNPGHCRFYTSLTDMTQPLSRRSARQAAVRRMVSVARRVVLGMVRKCL
jgi:hypothetical protein